MPRIKNPKHELFAQELAKGKTADEAYQLAGYKENRGNAATLKANQSIADRVAELLERSAVRAEITVATITENLVRIAQKAEEQGGPAGLNVAKGAWETAAKLHGLMVDRKHHSGDPELMPFVRIERVIVSPNRSDAAEDFRSGQILTDRNRRYNN
jgi:hypothetical protein